MPDRALVLSAGGLWAAWEVGAWSVLRHRYQPDLIVGASAGSWNGWVIAGGATPEELAQLWKDPHTGRVMQFRPHRSGLLHSAPLLETARDLFDRYRPRIPFALTVVELPSLRRLIVRDSAITWRHLAASCAIPFGFAPVEIDGKLYVDGGFRGGLPLWAAADLGARHTLALNVLSTPMFKFLHRFMDGRPSDPSMQVTLLEPSRRLGSIRDALVWNPSNVDSWIELGHRDASSITM